MSDYNKVSSCQVRIRKVLPPAQAKPGNCGVFLGKKLFIHKYHKY